MKILWYFLTALFGVIGLLALIRTTERLVSGAGLMPIQLVIAFVFLLLAVVCVKQARAAS